MPEQLGVERRDDHAVAALRRSAVAMPLRSDRRSAPRVRGPDRSAAAGSYGCFAPRSTSGPVTRQSLSPPGQRILWNSRYASSPGYPSNRLHTCIDARGSRTKADDVGGAASVRDPVGLVRRARAGSSPRPARRPTCTSGSTRPGRRRGRAAGRPRRGASPRRRTGSPASARCSSMPRRTPDCGARWATAPTGRAAGRRTRAASSRPARGRTAGGAPPRRRRAAAGCSRRARAAAESRGSRPSR